MNALLSAFNDVSVEASATGRETPYRNSVGPSSAREKEDAIGAVCGAMLDPTAYPHKDVENARLIAKLLAAAQAEEDNEDMARARAVAVEALVTERGEIAGPPLAFAGAGMRILNDRPAIRQMPHARSCSVTCNGWNICDSHSMQQQPRLQVQRTGLHRIAMP